MKSLLTKIVSFILLLLFSSPILHAQNAWINEFHYDNDGGDTGEFVEVVVEDASSYDLSLLSVNIYNGSDGESDGAYSVDTFTPGDTENGFTFYYLGISGIQNGAPDGFSLDYDGTLIQFISYEGDFIGVGGPAHGILSEDVGVEETGSTPVGESLQLSGTGTAYSDFTWKGPVAETPSQLNSGQTFGAVCTAPSTQASFSTPASGDIENNQITLNWSRGDGDGVIILAKEDVAVNEIPENGTIYNADADFSSGLADEIGSGNFVVYDGTSTSITISGLNKATEYHFAIFEYLSTNQCYLTQNETISVTTDNSLDQDSEIQAPTTQIGSASISSMANAATDRVEVFKFNISDLGTSDGKSTLLQRIVIEKSTDNEVSDWSSVIKGAQLHDGTSEINITDLSINQDHMEFDLTGNEVTISDGGIQSLTLSIWLEESQVDGAVLGFEIPAEHNFETEISGSSLLFPISNAIVSNKIFINVEASELSVASSKNEAFINDDFSISVTARDDNGNIDESERSVSISSNGIGTLSGDIQQDLVDGDGEFGNLSYDISEEIILTITDGTLSGQVVMNFIEPSVSIDASGFSNDFGIVSFPNQSDSRSYLLSASMLKDTLLVIAPDGFQLSLNPDFSNPNDSLLLAPQPSIEEEMFVRFSPPDNNGNIYQGNIIHISQDADTVSLEVSGQEGSLNLSKIELVREKALGERVKVHGVVIGGNNHFEERRIIQDETAGIAIEGMNSLDLNYGDSVEVKGVLAEIDDWLTIIPEKEINLISSDSIIVDPSVLSIAELNDSLESQRVKFEALSIMGEGSFTTNSYFVFNDTDSINLQLSSEKHPLIGTEIPIGKTNVTGFIGKKDDGYYIYPELVEDLDIIPRDTVLIIEAPEGGLDFGSVFLDEFSETLSYQLRAENLPEDLKISTNRNYGISLLENGDFESELLLPIDEIGDIPEIKVYVRFAPVAASGGAITEEIVHVSGNQEFRLTVNGFEEIITSRRKSLKDKVLIYPNPFNSVINVELLEQGNYEYQLLGSDGRVLATGSIMESRQLDVEGLESGIFLLKISNQDQSYLHRIIKD